MQNSENPIVSSRANPYKKWVSHINAEKFSFAIQSGLPKVSAVKNGAAVPENLNHFADTFKRLPIPKKGAFQPALIAAIKNQQAAKFDNLKTIIESNPGLLQREDRVGQVLLHHAAFHGKPEIVEALLKAGANVNARDYQGITPGMQACHPNSQIEILQKFLFAGANPIQTAANGASMIKIADLLSARSDLPEEAIELANDKVSLIETHIISTQLEGEEAVRCPICVKILNPTRTNIDPDEDFDTVREEANRTNVNAKPCCGQLICSDCNQNTLINGVRCALCNQ